MPCDTIQTSTVKMEMRADNEKFLLNALSSLGYYATKIGETIAFRNNRGTETGVFAKGELTITSRNPESFDLNKLKRAYSTEVVKNTAKKYGWELKPTAENKFSVQKKGF